jgi:hypothetical protein
MIEAGELVYLYAITPAADAAAASGDDAPVGIAGHTVTTVAEAGLTAIIGPVPTVEFDEAPLNANLANLDWLAPRAEAHQRVNAHVAERAAASLPLSFGTVFRSEDSLRAMLRERAAELSARLDAVRGCTEWIVTVRRDAARAERALDTHDPTLERAHRELEASSPGRRYLLERQLTELRRKAGRAADADVVREVAEAATRTARRVHAEPLVAATEAVLPAVSRLSALVERGAESQFCDTLDAVAGRWRERGYDVERSGPWPTYRFGGSL